ncbi:hypothetical protein Halar_2440 [halophilic archaeon DL31]|nr:hypothetical protein Halar_2440 [halophilic archaeon DL31]
MTECGNQLAPETVLPMLADDRRRAIVRTLKAEDESSISLEKLVDQITNYGEADGLSGSEDEYRQRVRIELYHTHLPKLAASGLIQYDRERGQIAFLEDMLTEEILTLVESYNGVA